MAIDTLLVKDVMMKDTFYVLPSTHIDQCVKDLVARKISGVPVADKNRRLIGFVSEQDMLPSLVQSAYYRSRSNSVESVMTHPVMSVKPTDDILNVAKMMIENHPQIYPVVEEGRLVGVITRQLVTKALLKSQENR